MTPLQLKSPAKINLRLEVLGRRADGYHNLRMVMTRVSLFDDITLTLNSGSGISIDSDIKAVPRGEENIAWRAADAFMRATDFKGGVHIDLKKRIPMGGGLGGGSSNAATVLMGLNRLAGSRLPLPALMDMGLKLGADVPFFIFKGPALAEGIGEKLSLIEDLPRLWLLLVNPGIEISTGLIFKSLNLRLTKNMENLNITTFNYSLAKVCTILHNDLEYVTFDKYPEVREIKERLQSHGAAGVLMSGSGSTLFSLYRSRKEAESAFARIEREAASNGWFVCLANSL